MRTLLLLLTVVSVSALDMGQRDKQLHAAGGFVLGALAHQVITAARPHWSPWVRWATATAAVSVVGAAWECNPKRTADCWDWATTTGGAALGAGGSAVIQAGIGKDSASVSVTFRF